MPMTDDAHYDPPTTCPCGGRLYSKTECLADPDPLMRLVGEMYLDEHSGYCPEEDEVVLYADA